MELSALQQTYTHPNRMKALERDARDLNHANGGGSFSLTGVNQNKPSSITAASKTDNYAGIKPLENSGAQSLTNVPSSGDIIEPALNVAGGFLMGGPVGALTALAGEAFEAITGDSVLGHVASLFTDSVPTATTLASANRAYLQAGELVKK